MALLAYWGQNAFRLGYESAWPSIAAFIALAALVTAVLSLMCRSWTRAGIAAGAIAVYLFYIVLVPGISSLGQGGLIAVHMGAIFALFGLFRLLPKDELKLRDFAGRLNAVFLIVMSISAAQVIVQQIRLEPSRSAAAKSLGELEGQAQASSPDVWHIILDRYPSAETLSSRYDFDNQPFLDALAKRGFSIGSGAFSNYQRTGHSVAATMNGSLLKPMSQPMANSPQDWVPIYRAMKNGASIRLFNRMGYETIFLGSWWEPTRVSNIASQSISINAMPQLSRFAIGRSAIGFWLRTLNLPLLDDRKDQCSRASEKFSRLRQIAGSSQRKYVFAHFLVPHPPFVLNADGSCRSIKEAKGSSRRDNFLAQVEFSNREALDLIDAILAGPRPAYVVLHSDEGPWPEPYVGNEHGLGTDPVPVPWTKLSPTQLREKFGILLAVRDPSAKTPQTMPTSPVQIYPALLRDHFGSSQPLPKSEHLVFEADDELYQWEDISAALKTSEADLKN